MKKKFLVFILLCFNQIIAQAGDLIEVFQQALISDPTYQQAIAQRLADQEGVPINVSALLPNLSITANPNLTRSAYAGNNYDTNVAGVPLTPRNNTNLGYTLALTATQTVFDFAKFANVAGAVATSKEADATLNAALQNLIVRVATAYFAILKDEENLNYSEASKLAYAKQLDQIKQQYEVGLKTVTDVYTAQASYDSAIATYITAENTVDNDRENLRAMTGKYYPKLSALGDNFPLITPEPANIDQWTNIAQQQNWPIKASQYNVDATRQVIKQQVAGHLPTVDVEGTLNKVYSKDINGYRSINAPSGTGTITNRIITVNLNVPIFSGGGVVAKINQAQYNYQVAQQQLEQTIRSTINTTRQSYLGILSGISQIKADQQTIKSTISSLQGLEASYQVGTETLVNVLGQQQKVFQAQTEYAADRYNYIINVFTLKQAAGTLSFDDVRAINAWLVETKRPRPNSSYPSLLRAGQGVKRAQK
ncbi:MAG TPA: TolC family outer membrane protein [Gammaproteobacteria bacterium]|nr:TolC family outer membrane protein [Gammaproteobacteria bacterium]